MKIKGIHENKCIGTISVIFFPISFEIQNIPSYKTNMTGFLNKVPLSLYFLLLGSLQTSSLRVSSEWKRHQNDKTGRLHSTNIYF